METTLSDARSFSGGPSAMPPRVRLPGEDEAADAGAPLAPTESEQLASKPAVRSRKGLMSSVGLAFLVGSICVVGYMQRARFEPIPAVREVLAKLPIDWTHEGEAESAGNGATTRKAVTTMGSAQPRSGAAQATGDETARLSNDHAAPVAKLAAPQVATSHAGASVAVASSPPVTLAPNLKALDAQQTQLAQFEAFKTGTPAPAASAASTPGAPAQAAVTPPPAKVAAHDVPGPERGVSANVAGIAPAGPEKTAPGQAAALLPKPAPAAADPVAQAVVLKAAPMAGQEQLNVIHLVTELGVLVRDQRTEIANLRGQVAEVSGKVNTQLMDFDRRLSIAEAKGAIDAAMGVGETTSTRVAAAPPPPPPAVKKVAPPPLVRNVSDYRIQAASPGLAMLSTTLDGGSSVQVAVGDEVPGIGHVQAILQNGTIWEVKTDHGVIR